MITNTTMAAMVTNASRLVHNGLIGATIVASGVYFVIAVRDQVLKTSKTPCLAMSEREREKSVFGVA